MPNATVLLVSCSTATAEPSSPTSRNCMRRGVKTKDGPGWRESRGESAVANKSRCSLWKDGVRRAGGGLFSPFREHLFTPWRRSG